MLGINLGGLAVALLAAEVAAAPTPEQQQWLAKAHRFERHGWIYVHLEGEAAARGFQAGYLLAPEIARGLSTSRVSWKHLSGMDWHKIDLALANQMEADHFDSFLKKNSPGPRSLCGHFEFDTLGGGASAVPFECSGTVDAKVVDGAMAGKMSFAARWGTACGMNFDAGRYLADHPQFDWMQEILQRRPSEPWTEFRGGG
jgi:hypothetical protein